MSDKAPIEALKAIAHPLRLQIIETLRSGEMNVGEIEQTSGIGQPALPRSKQDAAAGAAVAQRTDLTFGVVDVVHQPQFLRPADNL